MKLYQVHYYYEYESDRTYLVTEDAFKAIESFHYCIAEELGDVRILTVWENGVGTDTFKHDTGLVNLLRDD